MASTWHFIASTGQLSQCLFMILSKALKSVGAVRSAKNPATCLSGLWMWKGHADRGLFRSDRYHKKVEGAAAITGEAETMNPSERIDQLIEKLTDWRGETLAQMRKRILEADREIFEEWKWMGSPVWSRNGIIAVATVLKNKVKLTFANGANLPDPDKVFNAGLEGKRWRAIDIFEGASINQRAFKNLIRAAVDYNRIKLKRTVGANTRTKVKKKQ